MEKTEEISENILDFKIDFSYESNKEKTLKNVTGGISKGKCAVLCGESGCGDNDIMMIVQ